MVPVLWSRHQFFLLNFCFLIFLDRVWWTGSHSSPRWSRDSPPCSWLLHSLSPSLQSCTGEGLCPSYCYRGIQARSVYNHNCGTQICQCNVTSITYSFRELVKVVCCANWVCHLLYDFCYPGYQGALSQYILKKFFLLVLFLDRAKLTRVIDYDPCLFNRSSSYKVRKTIYPSLYHHYVMIFLVESWAIAVVLWQVPRWGGRHHSTPGSLWICSHPHTGMLQQCYVSMT